jgi:hypothetical protein
MASRTKTAKKSRPGRDAERVVECINDYYSREPDFFSKLVGTIDRPLDWMASSLPPDSHVTTSLELKKSALEPLAQTAAETFSNRTVFEDFSPPADSIEEVRERNVLEMWDVSEHQYDFNAVMTGLHGFGTGLGGPSFVAADVPSVMMTNFRLAAQVALSFGYDWSPEQFPLMLQAMSLGMDDVKRRVSHRQAIFIYLERLQKWIEENTTEDSIDDFIKKHLNEDGNVFGEWVAKSLDSLGAHLSSKALSRVVPVLGGAANAGINVWMITQTHHAAQAVYAERRLRDEYGDAWVNRQIAKSDDAPSASDEVPSANGEDE